MERDPHKLEKIGGSTRVPARIEGCLSVMDRAGRWTEAGYICRDKGAWERAIILPRHPRSHANSRGILGLSTVSQLPWVEAGVQMRLRRAQRFE